MVLRALVCLYFIFFSNYAFCQKNTSDLRTSECFEVTTINEDYIIKLGGVDYNDNDKAFICESYLEMAIPVQICEKATGNPVASSTWDWSNCECNPDSPNGPNASILFANFEGDDKLTIKVSFDNVSLKLSVKKIDGLSLDKKETIQNATPTYDDNQISQYPFYQLNATDTDSDGTIDDDETIPFQFLETSQQSELNFKGHKNILKSIQLEQVKIITDAQGNILGTSESVDLNITSLEKQATISPYLIPEDRRYLIKSCDDENIINLDVYHKKTLNIDLYSINESDDDQANYCTNFEGIPNNPNGAYMPNCTTLISSLPHQDAINYVCLLPGADLSLDLYAVPNVWVSSDDKPDYEGEEHTLKVLAGNNKICDTSPRPNGVNTFLTNQDINKISNDINEIYNKIGIDVNIQNQGAINLNYDSFNEDNIIDNTKLPNDDRAELDRFNIMMIDNGVFNNYTILIAPNMQYLSGTDASVQQIRGQAADLGKNILTLNEIAMKDHTPAHEMGHAFFLLDHPDTNPLQDGISGIMNCQFNGGCDPTNLMNSGTLQDQFDKKINEFILRKYQWDKIYRNL